MTTYNKNTLKTFFQTNDVPFGTDYANFIDSCLNIVDTAEQTIASPFNAPEIITPRVSATNVNITGVFSAQGALTVGGFTTLQSSALIQGALTVAAACEVGSLVSDAQIVSNGNLRADFGITVSGADVSANAVNVYCSSVRITSQAIVSAAGTAQGTGALLNATMCRLQGVNDGSATGFVIPANKTGLVQYIVNETAVSANLWPPTGGKINNLATNAVFPLTAGTAYTIFHTQASAYGVK